jgi:N,N'-diacetyllegionaminate synthase
MPHLPGGHRGNLTCYPWKFSRSSAEPTNLYIIAEAGVNHNGQINVALQLVNAAKQVGANCIKFQAYTTEELVTHSAGKARYQTCCGANAESQYEMLKRYELTFEQFKEIKIHCDTTGIDFLVTPFSPQWVKRFEDLKVPAYKIGSGNLQFVELLEAIGQTKKTVFLSKGMSTIEEADHVINVLRKSGSDSISLLHCISSYPTKLGDANLKTISMLASHTGLPVGFSDHTLELETGLLAVEEGAKILEKHLTLDRNLEGPDHAMSLNPEEMKLYIEKARGFANKSSLERKQAITQSARLSSLADVASGNPLFKPLPEELQIKAAAGMSVVAAQAISPDSIITRDMLTVKRPGSGIPADQIEQVVGTRAICEIEADQVIRPEDIR